MVVGDLVFSIPVVLYYILLDALNLPLRCFLPFLAPIMRGSPGFLMVAQGTLLFGIMSTVTVTLVAVALAALRVPERLLYAYTGLYLFDLGASLLCWLGGLERIYPAERTMLGTLFAVGAFVVLVTEASLRGRFGVSFILRYSLASGSLACWVTASRLRAAGFAASPALLCAASVPLLVAAVTPESFWDAVGRACAAVLKVAAAAAGSVWLFATRVWPHVRDFALRAWYLVNYHPAAVLAQEYVFKPVWRTVSPMAVPAATSLLTFFMARSAYRSLATTVNPVLCAAQVFCSVCSGLTTLVLAIHGVGRILRLTGLDPLRYGTLCAVLGQMSHALCIPFIVLKWIVWKIRQGTIARLCWAVLEELGRFATRNPLPALILTFFANISLLILGYCTPVGTYFTFFYTKVFTGFVFVLRVIASQFGVLQSCSLSESTDSTLAVVAICLSQTMIFYLVWQLMFTVWPRTWYTPEDTSLVTGLAGGMNDPRQCGRCTFGPVDYTGCNMLTSHHMERRGGGVVSNACPQCGWFVPRLDYWPYFNPDQVCGGASSTIRVRTFNDIAMALRAAAKACVIPFLILQVAGAIPYMPSFVGPLLAIGYLVPWAAENSDTFAIMSGSGCCSSSTVYPARHLNTAEEDSCCGRRPEPVAQVTTAEAIEAIETAAPAKCFLAAGATCPLCLEDFSEEATQAGSKPTAEAVSALRGLVPPIATLPCGHPLHLECAQQLVGAAQGSRQLRCPLCREPLSVTGSVSASLFN